MYIHIYTFLRIGVMLCVDCRVCQAAFSESMISWVHLKAMRLFVESILRFGIPARFTAFLVAPNKNSSKHAKLHAELLDVFTSNGLANTAQGGSVGTKGGKSSSSENSNQGQSGAGSKDTAGGDDDDADYYPYAYFPFSPLQAK